MRYMIFLFAGLFTISLLRADIQVIANASNQVDTISKSEIKQIFLGEKVNWKDGSKIKIADNLDKETAREFYSLYLGKEASRIKKIWIKKMLRGTMSPPESFKDIHELLAFISSKKQCIGFVANGKIPHGVKVLKVID